MEYKKDYKKPYKKADSSKVAYKPKRGNTDGSGLMVQGNTGSWLMVQGYFLVHGSWFTVND